MRKLMIAAATLLVVVLLAVAGAAGYLWYQTRQQADYLVQLAKPFAEISYAGVSLAPQGSIGIDGLRIMPHALNDTLSIGSLRLSAPNLIDLLLLDWRLRHGQLPEALALSAEQIDLPLDGGFLNAPVTPETDSPFDHLDALGCGSLTRFGGTEWRSMGYSQLLSDLRIGYRYAPRDHRLELQVDSYTGDWTTVNLDIGITTPAEPLNPATLLSFQPRLTHLRLVLRDAGFNARRNTYCAAKAGKSVEAYLDDHVRRLAERLRTLGIDPGPGLLDAYRRFLGTSEGELTVLARPPAPLDVTDLAGYTPEDVLKLLGLSVAVGSTPVSDLSLKWDAARLARLLNPEPPPVPKVETESPLSPLAPSTITVQREFHPLPVAELARHSGRIVRLQTSNGTRYTGQIGAINSEGMLQITVRKSGGSATLSLRLSDINRAEILE